MTSGTYVLLNTVWHDTDWNCQWPVTGNSELIVDEPRDVNRKIQFSFVLAGLLLEIGGWSHDDQFDVIMGLISCLVCRHWRYLYRNHNYAVSVRLLHGCCYWSYLWYRDPWSCIGLISVSFIYHYLFSFYNNNNTCIFYVYFVFAHRLCEFCDRVL